MSERFSYSRIDLFSQCGFKYKLRYVDGHYVDTGGLATELGTAIHETEEAIANSLKNNDPINYIALKNKLILTLCELEHKYPIAFYELDKSGRTVKDKLFSYLDLYIYRLEKFMLANGHIQILEAEKEFNFIYKDIKFHGFIDRILYDSLTNKYIVQDIKTYAVPVEKKNLATPLQFVVYTLAMKELYNIIEDQITCSYDLPFCDLVQAAGTPGYMQRGQEKLDELLAGIQNQDFVPNPTPLCHWCEFCPTNPNQPEAGKNLCPYYSLWTKTNKTFQTASPWKGLEQHAEVMQAYLDRACTINGV